MAAYVIVLALLFGVVFIVTQPFRRRAFAEAVGQEVVDDARPSELIELEASRDAKYREIRDAELDHQTGKLSDDDFEAIDSTLRGDAVSLLRKLDKFHAARGGVDEARAAQGGGANVPVSDAEDGSETAAHAESADHSDQ